MIKMLGLGADNGNNGLDVKMHLLKIRVFKKLLTDIIVPVKTARASMKLYLWTLICQN
jgi:hypothetical protein